VDLAKKIGVNEMTIVNWEKGKTKPDRKKFEKLRAILGNSMPSNWIVKT
jgi:DNA-binding XRE family transcriptional regulator